MTAKQLLLEYVEGLTEEQAEEELVWFQPHPGRSLTDPERAAIQRGLADARAGRLTPLEMVDSDAESA